MASTRLKRKARMNALRGRNKNEIIKNFLTTPVIKNVDVAAIKAEFKANKDK